MPPRQLLFYYIYWILGFSSSISLTKIVNLLAMGTKEFEASISPSPAFSSTRNERWWSKDTVAVVTGANKGIGYAFVKRLAELGLTVILTCRDVLRGQNAVDSLRVQGLDVQFFRLDVSDPASINAFVSWLREEIGGLDILVNNAGVSFNEIGENSVEHAEIVIRTNYCGTKMLTVALLPLFRRSSSLSRILNISSQLGELNKVRNPTIRDELQDEERLSEEQIDSVVGWFLESVKNGTWKEEGWPSLWTDYSVSKLALNAYSKLLAKRYKDYGLSINCFCPGFTRTAMTRGKGAHTADEAAEIGTTLILLPPHKLSTGKFYGGVNNSLLNYSKL
ncbi:hypothetical protein NE237_011985 [Protea cynaroides]|uniref:Uncharacterized protein n=1 Tax=Protea cynaroides TaxID=273540 RepID=A0A9Q0JXL1_9MAGN|nr:hypothetical protein NE237_011985 [Protea cynaroides]